MIYGTYPKQHDHFYKLHYNRLNLKFRRHSHDDDTETR